MSEKIVILGAGESGTGAAILAQKLGFDVFVSDGGKIADDFREELINNNIEYEEGRHTEARILEASVVIKSPGIPEKAEMMKFIRRQGIQVLSEVEFAYRYKGDSKIIAVTGSNGKTTTTSLIYHMCKTADMDVAMVGNVGISFAKQVALDPKQWYVVEVSSFQLDDIITFKPDIAVITNITEDHLDRYDYKVENYIRSKFKITQNQDEQDVFIYSMDDETTMEYLRKQDVKSQKAPITMSKEPNQGAYMRNALLHMKWKGEEMEMSIEDFALKGKHNQYNSMAASMAGVAVGIRKEKIRESMQTFESLEHRMEPAGTIRGVEFINDSKATNINSTWFALESMIKPTILILGGVDKGNDYSILTDLVKEKVKAIVCLGVDNSVINNAFKDVVSPMVNTASAQEAVQSAFHLAEKGDVVLLSPACASFDLFKNYEDRGAQFKQAIKEL